LSSSYTAYRINEKLVVGMAFNAPFGLSTKVDGHNWQGRIHHRSAKLLTLNLNPMASFQVAPGITIGLGVQFEYAALQFRTKSGVAPGAPNSVLDGNDLGYGFTAGILFEPTSTTAIGLGYRSAVSHTIRGVVEVAGFPAAGKTRFELGISTPEMVTLSVRQKSTKRLRALATIEWAHWASLNVPQVITSNGTIGTSPPGTNIANFDSQYDDGWFFAVGGEYDVNDSLPLRTYVAYEISPARNASQRLLLVPDNDRIWLSIGATYKVNENISFDFGYNHIFFKDASINRLPATTNPATQIQFIGKAETTTDILSASLKYQW
jgi:long-chain fatty acid transport protein